MVSIIFTENLYYNYEIILNPLSFYASTFKFAVISRGQGGLDSEANNEY